MYIHDTPREPDLTQELKLERLREELAKGEADIAAGRKVVIADDEELSALFVRL